MKNLNTLNSKKIGKALKAQEVLGWNFYNEREFLENLFCQRFNFFLVVYTIILAGIATVNSVQGMIIIESIGIVLTIGLWLTLYRAYIKLIILLKILHIIPEKGHVFGIINRELETYCRVKKLWGVNGLIGIAIPVFSILTLCFGLVATLLGWVEPFSVS